MRSLRTTVDALSIALLALLVMFPHAAVPLPGLGIDPTKITISGLSSGAYMAVQMHVAYSATFKGAGVVAGGPYNCAEGLVSKALGPCMAHDAPIPISRLVTTTRTRADQGQVDPVANLDTAKLYLFSGTRDSMVKPPVLDDLVAYYKNFVQPGNIIIKRDIAAEHGMVTDDSGNTCALKASPYINDCDFDLAGAILQQLYGPLSPRNSGTLSGSLKEFDQSVFAGGRFMAATGWIYVPDSCANSAGCRLHVALHGCKQNTADVGQDYVRKSGYNRWADTNRIVVLYPQTNAQAPNSCWDWWGYESSQYAVKAGPQMAALKAMVDRTVATGAVPDDGSGAVVSGTCHTATNFDHWRAGRATMVFGFLYAKGSQQSLGFWFGTSTLKENGPDQFVIGTCT